MKWLGIVCLALLLCGLSACSLFGKANDDAAEPEPAAEQTVTDSDSANSTQEAAPTAAEPEETNLPEIDTSLAESPAGAKNGSGSSAASGETSGPADAAGSSGQAAEPIPANGSGAGDGVVVEENGDILLPDVP